MKNMILILSIFFFITSCNEEEVKQQENSIYNQWSLIKYDLLFSSDEEFDKGKIIWEFKNNNKLNISVNDFDESTPIMQAGEYSFSLNNGESLSLANNPNRFFSISNDTLIINDYSYPSIFAEINSDRLFFILYKE